MGRWSAEGLSQCSLLLIRNYWNPPKNYNWKQELGVKIKIRISVFFGEGGQAGDIRATQKALNKSCSLFWCRGTQHFLYKAQLMGLYKNLSRHLGPCRNCARMKSWRLWGQHLPLSPFPWQLSISQEQKRCLGSEISLRLPPGMDMPY